MTSAAAVDVLPGDWEGLWTKIAGCAAKPFPPGWPPDEITLFAPQDDLHGALMLGLNACQTSYFGNNYGFTDQEAISRVTAILNDPAIPGMLCLDQSQLNGPTELKAVQAAGLDKLDSNRVVHGNSSRGKISHLKVNVIDAWLTFSGSTNLSLSGEEQQDNELHISRNPLIAGLYIAKIALDHNVMAAQMEAKASKAKPA